ncbi:MAG TPA: hypothetical protein VGH96_00380 [Streptosporangiaceae bacterium]|jgi:hypothetical protein
MDAYEIARRARTLPDQFAARLPEVALAGLRLMAEGGEYGELVAELTATLVKTRAVVSAAEQRELRALLEAMGIPASQVGQLTISD